MYARDGVVTLRESPSTIYSLVSLLVLISQIKHDFSIRGIRQFKFFDPNSR